LRVAPGLLKVRAMLVRAHRTALFAITLAITGCSDPAGGPSNGTPVVGPEAPGPAPGTACLPACSGKECGDDGCGSVCGACGPDRLCSASFRCEPLPAGAPDVLVDAQAGAHPIHRTIYGMNFAPRALAAELALPVNRWGGNGTTRYNWKVDVSNHASDWYFENIENDGDGTYGTLGYVPSVEKFVIDNKSAGAASVIAMPTIGWTPKERARSCSFPVDVYGPQERVDPYQPPSRACGNGKSPSGQELVGDPARTSMAIGPAWVGEWVARLVSRFGRAADGGVGFYTLDNEMNLWNDTHRDVHPEPVGYDEIWQKTRDYAPAIRAADPTAMILGFGTWGALDLLGSAKDVDSNWADKRAHGDVPLVEWYLAQLADHERRTGARLIDCLDLHHYTQGGDPVETTRTMWDPTYRDPSWLNDVYAEPIRLIPRVREWVARRLPGMQLCFTEYNQFLRDEDNPRAALAQADMLGIFGKQGVRLATYWTNPLDENGNRLAAMRGFEAFLSYDGRGARFGDVGIDAATLVPSLSAWASTDGARATITLVLVHKATSARTVTIGARNFQPSGAARIWQYAAETRETLTPRPDVAASANGTYSVALPAESITVVRLGR
jgi:hypothetical protein